MTQDPRVDLDQARRTFQSNPMKALGGLWHVYLLPQLPKALWNETTGLLEHMMTALGVATAPMTFAMLRGNATRAIATATCAIDRARAYELFNAAAEACESYAQADYLGHAAFQAERARDPRRAIDLWRAFLGRRDSRLDPYTRALATVNLSRVYAAAGDARLSRTNMIEGVRLIEATAAHLESTGMRERAFDCYQVLLSLGRNAAFENLAEGYLNCIRILRDDHLRTYVLQYYEDFQRIALERGEYQAAATLFREAAAYCRAQRLPYAAQYLRQAADAHVSTAMAYQKRSASPEIVENAYLSAAECFNELGLFAKSRSVYGALVELDLAEARRARYRRLAARLSSEADEFTEFPKFQNEQKSSMAYPDVWRLDVLEWELDADVAETMADVMLDQAWPSETRQRAFVCRMRALVAGAQAAASDRASVCDFVGATEIYPALAIVERFARDEDLEVRAAAMRALSRLFFKRSFVALRVGLDDTKETIRAEAERALGKLYFPHAFDPLRRVCRESKRPSQRATALKTIARVPTREAAEFLVDTLIGATSALSVLAATLIRESRNPHLDEVLTAALEGASPETKRTIEETLSARRR